MKHGVPDLYLADDLREWTIAAEIGGRYVRGRPLGFQGWCLRRRLQLAWRVFVGKYDALKWEGQ